MESIFKIIETAFNFFINFALGLIGFIILLFVLAILFGKRIYKKWEFEANFYNDKNKEVGEFDIEMKKYAKEKGDYSLDANFRLKHTELMIGRVVQNFLEDVLVMEGVVEKKGRITLNN